MKLFIALVSLSLASFGALAVDRDVEIECKLSPAQSSVVDKVNLLAVANEIKIHYRNGSTETVKPVELKNAGIFGTENFSADLAWDNGQVAVSRTAVGPLFVRFNCFLTPTIAFERCISQGTHETARFSGVRMNLQGKVHTFFGQNICSRIDRSPR